MNTKPIKYIAESAPAVLQEYIESKGYRVERIRPLPQLPAGIADHPDLRICRLGIGPESETIRLEHESELGSTYPRDIPYNSACTGRYLICNTEHTEPRILEYAREHQIQIIHTKQGYAKCSIVIVDENSIITYDHGIARKAKSAGLEVLTVAPGHVILEGYETGFIGGCTGRIDDEIIFNGDLSKHPDAEAIINFIESKGLKATYFTGYELTDIGSII